MTQSPCQRLWEVGPYRDGAFGAKDAASFERHVRGCPHCREQLHRDECLSALVAELPGGGPGEIELRRTRARVLRTVAMGPAPRTVPPGARMAVGFSVLALACAGALWMTGPKPGPSGGSSAAGDLLPVDPSSRPDETSPLLETWAGSVEARTESRWSRAREPGTERVTLEDGVIRVHVRHLGAGERFLVALPDGELEVRGTTFEVAVQHATTMHVHVDEGVVELRLQGHDVVRLAADANWSRGSSSVASTGLLAGGASSRPAAPAPTSSAEGAPSSTYAMAIQLLREGRNDEAARAFHDVLTSAPAGPQAEDASFLQAVALARAGQPDAAAAAAEKHLVLFPSSFHRRDAAMLIARAEVRHGRCAQARALLADSTAAGDKEALSTLSPCASR
jgi:hypothetical protein